MFLSTLPSEDINHKYKLYQVTPVRSITRWTQIHLVTETTYGSRDKIRSRDKVVTAVVSAALTTDILGSKTKTEKFGFLIALLHSIILIAKRVTIPYSSCFLTIIF